MNEKTLATKDTRKTNVSILKRCGKDYKFYGIFPTKTHFDQTLMEKTIREFSQILVRIANWNQVWETAEIYGDFEGFDRE